MAEDIENEMNGGDSMTTTTITMEGGTNAEAELSKQSVEMVEITIVEISSRINDEQQQVEEMAVVMVNMTPSG